jgi:hypothetical protein
MKQKKRSETKQKRNKRSEVKETKRNKRKKNPFLSKMNGKQPLLQKQKEK